MRRDGKYGPARIVSGPPTEAHWAEIEEIFFLSAARHEFASAAAKTEFAERWIGYYRSYEPGLTFIALGPDGRVAGYLTGCADSRGAAQLYRDIPYYSLFEDQFEPYPAHFHINCRPGQRGRGVGAALVSAFIGDNKRAGRPGVHIVTDPEARNVGFYRRVGMDTEIRRTVGEREFLFMAVNLKTS